MGGRHRVAVGDVARLHLPHRSVVVAVQEGLVIGVGHGKPAAELLLVGQPAQESTGGLRVWYEGKDRVADRGQQMKAAFRTRRVERLVGNGADFREVSLAQPE